MFLFKLKVRMVKQIGGETLADAVKRAWERVLSLEVRAVVNWSGKERKDKPQNHKLQGMKVTEAIFSMYLNKLCLLLELVINLLILQQEFAMRKSLLKLQTMHL